MSNNTEKQSSQSPKNGEMRTTGHDWDGIQELDNPMPRWWLWSFIISIAWAAVYLAANFYWPTSTGIGSGFLNYSSRAELADTMQTVETGREKYLVQINALSLEEIRADKDLDQFAYAGGKSAFAINCSQCHGSGAAGAPGYPNLNDDNWLWGGSLAQIHTTIAHGIRFAQDEDTRWSDMPNFGTDEMLDKAQIDQVSEFVLSLYEPKHDPAKATAGATVYAENCVDCHGDKGQGNREMGAPQLANMLSLYGHSKAALVRQVTQPKHGVMPAWAHRLDEATIKQLTVYVHALGGGEQAE